jgi:Hydrolase of X-linked nucleoside diphosphate N terminal
MEPGWLEWARKLNALAQTGLTFAENPYDIERFTEIRTIAAEMIAQGSGAETSQVLDLLASDAGYATPKVDVRGVVFRDGKILLVQERSDGFWTLPGGWADVGDSPVRPARPRASAPRLYRRGMGLVGVSVRVHATNARGDRLCGRIMRRKVGVH